MAEKQIVTLFWTNEKDPLLDTGELNRSALVIDCTPSIEIMRAAQVTENPIETGAKINDHLILQPRKVSLRGIVSNYPIVSGIAGAQTIYYTTIPIIGINITTVEYERIVKGEDYIPDRHQTTYDMLNDIFRYRRLVNIVTDLEVFKNFVCTELTIPRSAKTAESIEFSMSFTEVRFVRSEYVDMNIPPKRVSNDVKHTAKPPVSKGKTAPEEEKQSSILKDVADLVGGS